MHMIRDPERWEIMIDTLTMVYVRSSLMTPPTLPSWPRKATWKGYHHFLPK